MKTRTRFNIWISCIGFMLIAISTATAQDVSSASLTWNVSSLRDLNTNEDFENYDCQFATSGGSEISWLQKNGTRSTLLSITGSNGLWTDVSSSGSITYQVIVGEKSGTVLFQRDGNGLSVTLDLSDSSNDRIYQKYTVSTVQTN